MSARARVGVLLAALVSLVLGFTADTWNPCAGDHVCVIHPYTGGDAP